MASVFAKDSPKMAFVEWNEKVEALAPDGSDQSFAIRIRFGCARTGVFKTPFGKNIQAARR
jgi:hypothetical protein